jgi:hypothetical protein
MVEIEVEEQAEKKQQEQKTAASSSSTAQYSGKEHTRTSKHQQPTEGGGRLLPLPAGVRANTPVTPPCTPSPGCESKLWPLWLAGGPGPELAIGGPLGSLYSHGPMKVQFPGIVGHLCVLIRCAVRL